MNDVSTVIDEALALPSADRSYLVERLIASLDEDGTLSPEWREEIEQRVARRERGETRTYTRDEVSRDVDDLLSR
jgi:putative addiction module component (TIGR02574 family)